jgi:hypothetical protein
MATEKCLNLRFAITSHVVVLLITPLVEWRKAFARNFEISVFGGLRLTERINAVGMAELHARIGIRESKGPMESTEKLRECIDVAAVREYGNQMIEFTEPR